jgi:5-formyltetrahydrofolate cyclo-ligase
MITPSTDHNASNKAGLRRSFRLRRRLLLPDAEIPLQAHACRSIPPLLARNQRLCLYWPLRGEPDLRLLAQQPASADQLALPRVAHGRISYHAWHPGMVLSPDDTGIPAPPQGPELEPEQLGLLLAPALACDHQGIRLGYGGGWFDRLRRDPAWRAVPAITVQPAGCVVEQLPTDPWDIPFHGRLDEHGLHWLQAV